MSGRIFLDTNILICTFDMSDPKKQERALNLLHEGLIQNNAVLSAQVLSEFFTVATKHLPEPISIEEARGFIGVVEVLQIVEMDLPLVKRAIETHEQYTINYWDALIVAAAERARCDIIFSEDLSAGQQYHNIKVENPF